MFCRNHLKNTSCDVGFLNKYYYHSFIDWNFHIGLPQKKSQSGEDIVTRKYNPRTRQWDVKKVKCTKDYTYVPVLISRIIRKRNAESRKITRVVDFNQSDPAIIAPTIAHTPPPSTKEIAARRSQFEKH